MSNNTLNIQKPKLAYLCSFFPREAFEKLGFKTISLTEYVYKVDTSCPRISTNICGYIHYCQMAIDKMDVDGVVITNCCNGMQRIYDYIKMNRPELFCYLLELPRNSSKEDNMYFGKSINVALKYICKHFSVDYNQNVFEDMDFSDKFTNGIEEETIYILASAISHNKKEKLLEYLKGCTVKINNCTSRNIGDFLAGYSYRLLKYGDVSDELKQADIEPCARMGNFLNWFEGFINKNRTRLKGIIYISSQHCDHFLFSSPSIKSKCEQYHIPFLEMEEGYMQTGYGQISTRIEAFLESLNYKAAISNKTVAKILPDNNVIDNDFKQRMRLVSGISRKLPLVAIQKVVDNQIDIFTDKVWKSGDKVVWTNMVMPVEIFYAAGLIPVNMELVAGWLASLGLSRQYISKSEGLGFNPSLCSYHKASVGVVEAGRLPYPKGAAISTHICDGGIGVVNHFEAKHNTKTFILNIPFHNNESNKHYVIQQYKELISWIEKVYGIKLTKEALNNALKLSNLAREYWIKAFELRKGIPLFPGHLSLRNLFGATFLFGSQLGADVAKSYYEQLLELSRNASYSLYKRKKRILWIHFAPLYANGIMQYLENDLGCCIVLDITGYIFWPEYDLDNPLESLANRSLSHFYLQEAELRRDLYIKLIDEYKIEGIIHFMHNGCRAIPGSSWLIRDIAARLKLPYLELNGDCIDPRGFSESQIRLRMEAFRESLGGDKFVFGD